MVSARLYFRKTEAVALRRCSGGSSVVDGRYEGILPYIVYD
ncbi:hypothetical protein HanIR_Chr09g0411111 [Helianthus annuus]|nr:hypothetical protein HanIR_Chr09g0411101 [Helianthus annuus]KAJ0533672.1 hypothetical protein HanIR_Chr09g0411111 [Helianthus annuus]